METWIVYVIVSIFILNFKINYWVNCFRSAKKLTLTQTTINRRNINNQLENNLKKTFSMLNNSSQNNPFMNTWPVLSFHQNGPHIIFYGIRTWIRTVKTHMIFTFKSTCFILYNIWWILIDQTPCNAYTVFHIGYQGWTIFQARVVIKSCINLLTHFLK